jgi:hypothetical protein
MPFFFCPARYLVVLLPAGPCLPCCISILRRAIKLEARDDMLAFFWRETVYVLFIIIEDDVMKCHHPCLTTYKILIMVAPTVDRLDRHNFDVSFVVGFEIVGVLCCVWACGAAGCRNNELLRFCLKPHE